MVHCVEAVIGRVIRSGLCEFHHNTVDELVDNADDKLFSDILRNKEHFLNSLALYAFAAYKAISLHTCGNNVTATKPVHRLQIRPTVHN